MAASHGVPPLRGDRAGGAGELRPRLWQAGGDRGRDRPEPRSGGRAGHGAHADQFQAPLAHGHHHSGAAARAAEEGVAQGVRGGGGGAEVGEQRVGAEAGGARAARGHDGLRPLQGDGGAREAQLHHPPRARQAAEGEGLVPIPDHPVWGLWHQVRLVPCDSLG